MENWFECKVSYNAVDENGKDVKKKSTYLIDALSFTEAEARFITHLTPFISGEFLITDIKRVKIYDIVDNGQNIWYRGKLQFITIDERSGKEKKTNQVVMLIAENITEAKAEFDKYISTILGEVTLVSISETDIIDVVKYNPE